MITPIDPNPGPDDNPEEFARVVEEVRQDEQREIAADNPPVWDVYRRARHRLAMRRSIERRRSRQHPLVENP